MPFQKHFGRFVLGIAACAIALPASVTPMHAATCVNKYIYRQEGPKLQVTLLTGKLTFQEAKSLAKDISQKKASSIEWLDANGKTIAKQAGELIVLRPMPVGCDSKTSGSVISVTFLRPTPPSGKLAIKLPSETVVFEEQKQ
jgi:hypothetical protein